MQTDSIFLKTLQDKEAELLAKLEETPIWKQIAGIRSTIELFKQGENGHTSAFENPTFTVVPSNYPVEGSWGAKILYILNKRTSGFVDDLMKDFETYEPGKYDSDTLYKRISQNASVLKKNGDIDGVKTGLKVKYYKK
jgi:hypothetical protein